MNSESYINRSMSNKPQIGSVRRAVSLNFKSGWRHGGWNEHGEVGDNGRRRELRDVALVEQHETRNKFS